MRRVEEALHLIKVHDAAITALSRILNACGYGLCQAGQVNISCAAEWRRSASSENSPLRAHCRTDSECASRRKMR
jgi:hypothetical protein